MNGFDPIAYGPVFAPLLDVDRRRPLDRGSFVAAMRPAIEELDLRATFAHATKKVADPQMGACCLAAAWLLYDFLDESHIISQHIETPTGSFWHGIMHRREGDFSNAKYWFRQFGDHEAYGPLLVRAVELAVARGADDLIGSLAPGGDWDPAAFVDLCETVVNGGEPLDLCLDVQQAEWELLFDYSYRAAVGA